MSNADLDDLPIISGPLRGTGEAPDVRPPSMVQRERRAREEARANDDDAPADAASEIDDAASDEKSLRDKVAAKIEQAGEKGKEVADRLAEKIGSGGGSGDPPAR